LGFILWIKHEVLPPTEMKKPGFFYGYAIVAAAFLIMVMMWGTLFSFGVFFPSLLDEFNWTRATTSGALSLSLILYGFFAVVAGRFVDRFGPRVVVTICGLFMGTGYLLVSGVTAIWQLYLYYGLLVAIGMSGSFVPLSSTVARWFVKRRGMMIGITVSGIGAGTLVMPPLAHLLISNYGWRTSYIIVGITVLVSVTLAARFLRHDPRQIGQLPYGETESGEGQKYTQPKGVSLQKAIQNRQFWMLAVAFLCATLSTGAVQAHIVLHSIDMGISAANGAVVLAVTGGLSTVGRVIMGSASDRIGNKQAITICFVLMAAALFWLIVARDLWMLYLFAVVYGFGYGGLSPLISLILAEKFGLSSLGAILGVIIIGVQVTEGSGTVMAGLIFDVVGSYNPAFLTYGAATVMGLVLILLLKPLSWENST
jgi:MFS family permease